jgi:hypothetical protein
VVSFLPDNFTPWIKNFYALDVLSMWLSTRPFDLFSGYRLLIQMLDGSQAVKTGVFQ